MAKSRSRSPRWKPRPQFHRSPEQHRQRRLSDEGFHRDARRPIHWEDDRHGHNNSRTAPYNRFNDKPFEKNSFLPNPRRSPLEPADRLRRVYSPERHGESSRRFSPKYPEDAPPRDNDHNFYHHRHQGRNVHDNVNGFREGRREDSFPGPPRRDPDWDWRENEDHWNKEGHRDQYVSPHRRNSQEHGFIPKRYPEDRNVREHGQPPKRPRETEELDHRPLPRNTHWKPDHTFRPPHSKDWSKGTEFRNPSPIIHRANSGEFTKIEYDYSHKSPSYVGVDLPLPDGYTDNPNRPEERKPIHAKSSHHSKPSDNQVRERGKFASERVQHSSPKYNSKRCPNRDKAYSKNENSPKPHNHKFKEKGRTENNPHMEQSHPRVQLDQSSNSSASKTTFKNIPSTETITVNLDVKKPVDKYRRDLSSADRQMSQDLVVSGRKENFRPVFDHLDSTTAGVPGIPKTEFTHEIITIIHEVKANHFKCSDVTLHERFSKLHTDGNKQNLNLNAIPPQTNPEIHRRIDISLEDLQNKAVDRMDVPMPSKRVIEDPNDLRHDIERRRKERLQVGENGSDATYQEREATNSYYRPQNHEPGEYHVSSRLHRPPFRKSTGRPPASYYRGKPNHFFSSQNRFEQSEETRRPYTGRGDGNPDV